MIQHTIILASGSPRRKELLEQMGVNPLVIPSRVEEHITETDPALVVEELSCQKAEDVALNWGTYMIEASESESPLLAPTEENVDQVPIFDANSAIVIGADTVVSVDDKILGKPADAKDALSMLMNLSGRTHEVFTGVTCKVLTYNSYTEGLLETDSFTFYSETKVKMYSFDEYEALDYIATGEPMDKAGAYGIQGIGERLVESINGDYNNVVGFPLSKFMKEMSERGYIIYE